MNWYTKVSSSSELDMGIAIEMEHLGTVKKIKDSIIDGKITMTDEEICRSIAEEHLEELPDYYTRLKRMEENAKI